MKQWKFKGWVRTLLQAIALLIFMLIVATLDSEFTLPLITAYVIGAIVIAIIISLLEKH